MQIHMPHSRGPVLTVFGGVIFGAVLAGAGPQVPAFWDRPACAETVMQAVSSGKVVNPYDRDQEQGWDHVDFVIDALLAEGNSGSGSTVIPAPSTTCRCAGLTTA